MTLRAVILGLALGLAIAALTYYNDCIIRQSFLIGSLLPIGIFGILALLLIANPGLRLLGRRWLLRPAELAVMTALALAVCGWPGSGFFRTFTSVVALPSQMVKNQSAWQAARVMSYVPGGSAQLAEGFITDWPGLVAQLAEAGRQGASGPRVRVWERLGESARRMILEAAARGQVEDSIKPTVLKALDAVIEDRTFYAALAPGEVPAPVAEVLAQRQARLARREALVKEQEPEAPGPPRYRLTREIGEIDGLVGAGGESGSLEQRANRLLLAALFPGAIAPPPPGEGALLAGGRAEPFAVDTLQQGWHGEERLGLADLPWGTWWPTLALWGTVAVLMGMAALCLALVVHPQWSHRELLTYPIARFVEEVTRSTPDGRRSEILKARTFWYGFGAMVLLGLTNGLHNWFPETFFISIPDRLNFIQITELFPGIQRVPMWWALPFPALCPMAVAFAFFLRTEVSLSIGIATIAWVIVGGALIANGIPLTNEYLGAGNQNLLLFGSYAGCALMIVYTGRRYYLNVAASAIGLPRKGDTPAYSTWAARALVLCTTGAVYVLTTAGLDWPLSIVLVLLVLLIFLVVTRINVETGAFFIQTWWLPSGIILGLFGVQAVSPQALIVCALGSMILVGDPREMLMPFLSNGLRMAEAGAKAAPRRIAPLLMGMIAAGFVIALVATLSLQYNHGVNYNDAWATGPIPMWPFHTLTQHIDQLASRGILAQTTALGGLDSLRHLKPGPGNLLWVGLGAALVIGCAMARLRISWWFIHPVLFLVWGTYPGGMLYGPFLMGWALKEGIVRIGGAKAYHAAQPVMVGVIAGQLIAALGWMFVGAVYYLVTHKVPAGYSILPG